MIFIFQHLNFFIAVVSVVRMGRNGPPAFPFQAPPRRHSSAPTAAAATWGRTLAKAFRRIQDPGPRTLQIRVATKREQKIGKVFTVVFTQTVSSLKLISPTFWVFPRSCCSAHLPPPQASAWKRRPRRP